MAGPGRAAGRAEGDAAVVPPQDGVGEEVLKMSTEEIVQRTRLLDSEIKVAAGPRRPGNSVLLLFGAGGLAQPRGQQKIGHG